MNLLSCLGRQGGDSDPPDTPNIDQLRTFINRFKQNLHMFLQVNDEFLSVLCSAV